MRINQIIVFALMLALAAPIAAQDNKGTGPQEKSIGREISIRKQQKKDRKEKRRREKEERKAVKKHHKRLQTKQVQKRMKTSRKKAIRNNEHRREFFLKRWFSRKHSS